MNYKPITIEQYKKQYIKSYVSYLPRKDFKTEELAYSPMMDYNDPMQVNSLADAVLNKAALERGYDVGDWLGSGVIQSIWALGDVMWKGTLRPLIGDADQDGKADWNWKASGINTLINVGETMDVLANPVKGLLLEGKEGFINALGLSDEGRVNYDYEFDTGYEATDLILELAAEIISDPLNWISFGGAEVLSSGAKKGLLAILKSSADDVTQEFIEQSVKKGVKAGTDDLLNTIIEPSAIKRVYRTAEDYMKTQDLGLNEALIKSLQDNSKVLKGALINPAADISDPNALIQKVLDKASAVIANDMTINVLEGVNKLVKYSDQFERALLKGSAYSNPIIGALRIGKSMFENKWGPLFKKHIIKNAIQPLMENNILPIEKFAMAEDAFKNARSTISMDSDITVEVVDQLKRDSIIREQKKLYDIAIKNKDIEKFSEEISTYIKNTHRMSLKEWIETIDEMSKMDPMLINHYDKLKKLQDALITKQDTAEYLTSIKRLSKEMNNPGVKAKVDEIVSKIPVNNQDTNALQELYEASSKTKKDYVRVVDALEEVVLKEKFEIISKGNEDFIGVHGLHQLLEATENMIGAGNLPARVMNKLSDVINILNKEDYTAAVKEIIDAEGPDNLIVLLDALNRHINELTVYATNHTVQPEIIRLAGMLFKTDAIPSGAGSLDVLQATADSIDNMLQFVENFTTGNLVDEIISMSDELRMYGAKMTQAQAYLNIIKNPSVVDLIPRILDPESVLYKSGISDETLNTLWTYAQGYESFTQLMFDVINSPVLAQTEWIRPVLFDTMQSYANVPTQSLGEAQDYFISKIIQDVVTQINVSTRTTRLKNEDILNTLKANPSKYGAPKGVDGTQWLLDNGIDMTELHDAGVDIAASEFITKHYFGKTFDETELPFYIDTETTGLSVVGDTVIELAYKIGATHRVIKIRPGDQVAIREVLNNIAPDSIKGLSDKTIMEWFNRTWSPEYAAEHGEVFFENIEDALQLLLNDLRDAAATGKSIVGVGQNIAGFDFPLLRNNISRYLGVAAKDTFDSYFGFNNINNVLFDVLKSTKGVEFTGIYDTYIEALKLTDNVVQLTPQQYDELYEILYRYTGEILDTTGGSRTLVPQFGGGFTRTLLKANREAADAAAKTFNYEDSKKLLMGAREQIFMELGDIRRMNRDLDEYWVTYKLGEDKSAMWYVLKENLLAPIGLKVVGDPVLIKQYFGDLGDALPRATIAELTAIAKRIRRIKNILPDVNFVNYDTTVHKNKLLWLLNNAEGLLQEHAMLRKTNIDFRQALAQVSHIYNNDKNFAKFVQSNVDDRMLLEVIGDPKLFRKKYLYKDPDIFNVFSDTIKHTHSVRNELDGLQDSLSNLRKLDELFVNDGLYHPGAAADFAMQEKIIPVVERFKNVYDDLLGNARELSPEVVAAATVHSIGLQSEAIRYVTNLAPEDFSKHLWHNAKGILIINTKNIGADYIGSLDIKAIRELGIKIKILSEDATLYYYPKSLKEQVANLAHPNKVPMTKLHTAKLPPALQEVFDEIHQVIDDVTDVSVNKSTWRRISESSYKRMVEGLPEDVQKELFTIKELRELKMFKALQFDYSNLGLPQFQREYNKYISPNLFKNYTKLLNDTMTSADAVSKFRLMFFNEKSGLHINDLFKDTPDEELLQLFKTNKDFTMATIVQDSKSKTGLKLIKIKPTSMGMLKQARQLNAIAVSNTTYNLMMDVLNKHEMSDPLLKFLSDYIVDPYKAGYLSSFGLLFRNTVDSTFKNLIETKSPVEAALFMKHTFATAKNYRQFIIDERSILELSQKLSGNPDSLITRDGFIQYFAQPQNAGRKDLFKMLYNFITEGPSAGISQKQLDVLKESGKITDDATFLRKVIWRNPYTHMIMRANTTVEHIARLSKYTWELSMGASKETAAAAVLRTHFDYGAKSHAQTLLDLVLPFSSFTIENTKYWLEAISESGRVASIMRDVLTPVIDLDDYDVYELNRNRSIQYHILSGNMVMDDNMVLKLNMSIMDMFNILTDPINSLSNRIIAPLRITPVVLQDLGDGELTQEVIDLAMQNLPMVGPVIQKFNWEENPITDPGEFVSVQKGFQRTGNVATAVLPSLLGGTYRLYHFSYGNTIYTTTNKDTFVKHMENGAVPISTELEANKKRAVPKQYSSSKTTSYRKRYYPRTSNYRYKSSYVSYPYFKKHYIPKAYRPYAQEYVQYIVRSTQFRMPGYWKNLSYTAPALYKRLYTSSGSPRNGGANNVPLSYTFNR